MFSLPRLTLPLIAGVLAGTAMAQDAAFLPSYQATNWAVTQTSTATKNYFVPTTNANRLLVTSNQATTNLQVTVGDPGNGQFGVVNYIPTAAASTNTFQLVASNSTNASSATTNLTIICQPVDPLQVRIYDRRTNVVIPVQVLAVGTGANDKAGNCKFYYVTNGVTKTITNGYSVAISNLPVAYATNQYGTNIPYRTLFVSNVQSGTLWFGLTGEPYTNALGKGNPAGTAAPGVQWSQAPFGVVEYAYTGGGYDTADTTMINEVGVPMLLRLADSNGLAASSTPVGVTNSNTLATVVPKLRQMPGVNWFGAAPNTNLIRLLGPSSAASKGIQMAYGGATNQGNFTTGWPGFSATPMSPYVSKVAYATTNGSVTNPVGGVWGMTKIRKQIGDPESTWAADSQWYFTADLAFVPNTNANTNWGSLASNYVTPVPVLTNVTITNIIIPKTNANARITNSYTTNGLAVAYAPDSGSPTNSTFSFYIYAAPASFNAGTNQGYVAFFKGGTNDQYYWTNLANYPGVAGAANSPNWLPYVLDAFLNEIAFGFAGGFVQSPVLGYTNGWQYNPQGRITNNTNPQPPATNSGAVPIGMMDSSQWWQQTNVYAQLQPGSPADYPWYSQWGNGIFEINPTIYSHPISDRLQYDGFTPGMPLGIANTNTNVWMEVYLYDEPSTGAGSNSPAITLITTNGVAVPGGVFTNVIAPPSHSNSIYLDPTFAGDGTLTAVFPATVVTATNTNGGGLWIGSLPNGLTYDHATRTIAGTLRTTNTGWQSIGLMPYGSNNVSVGMIPVYVNAPLTVPVITEIYPETSGLPGDTLLLVGSNFINFYNQEVTRVLFSAGSEPIYTTSFFVFDDSYMVVTVPTNGWRTPSGGLKTGPIRADSIGSSYTNIGIASTSPFTLRLPVITNFSPSSGLAGTMVNMQGFFYGATNVTFSNAVSTTNFEVINNFSNLVVAVPAGATSGPVRVDAYYTNTGVSNGAAAFATNAVSQSWFTVIPPAVVPQGLIPTNISMARFQPYVTNSAHYAQFLPWTSLEPSVSLAVYQLTVSNAAASMKPVYNAAYYSEDLPRGIHLTNAVINGQVYGYLIGAPIDNVTTNVAIIASNSAGTNRFTVPFAVSGFAASYPGSGPGLYGSNSFSIGRGVGTNLAVTYSNGPTYFEVSGLPAGMTKGITVMETTNGESLTGEFALSLQGIPVTAGTYPVTIAAVNATGSQGSGVNPTTNTTNITIIVSEPVPPVLSYGSWVGYYPTITGTNTNAAADPDGDGFINGNEYAFGGDPTVGTPALLSMGSSNVSFIALSNAATNYTVQNTTNLKTGPWTNYPVTVSNATNQLNIPLPAYYQRQQFTVPITPGTNNFYRVTFTNP